MRSEHDGVDRRRRVRVRVHGRVVIHGERYGRGEIVDVSSSGIRFRLGVAAARFHADEPVDLDVRFDGTAGAWWRLTGRVIRIDPVADIVVAFHDVPTDFEDSVQAELVASLESEGMMHVLLVDPVRLRRGRIAASLRAGGRLVSEAATPLDAIDRLGESGAPRMIAIADTVPAHIADDLRAYVRLEHAHLGMVRMTGAR